MTRRPSDPPFQPLTPLTPLTTSGHVDGVYRPGTHTGAASRVVVIHALEPARLAALTAALAASHIAVLEVRTPGEILAVLAERTPVAVVCGADVVNACEVARAVRTAITPEGVPFIAWLPARAAVPVGLPLTEAGIDAVLDERHGASDVLRTIGAQSLPAPSATYTTTSAVPSTAAHLSGMVRPLTRSLRLIVDTALAVGEVARAARATPAPIDEQALLFEARSVIALLDLLHREDAPAGATSVDLGALFEEQLALVRRAVPLTVDVRRGDRVPPCVVRGDSTVLSRVICMGLLHLWRQAAPTDRLTAWLQRREGERDGEPYGEAELHLLCHGAALPLDVPPPAAERGVPVTDPTLQLLHRQLRELGGSLVMSASATGVEQLHVRLPLIEDPSPPVLHTW